MHTLRAGIVKIVSQIMIGDIRLISNELDTEICQLYSFKYMFCHS